MSKEIIVLGAAAGIGAIIWYKTKQFSSGRKKTAQNAQGQPTIWNNPNGYDTIIGYSTPLAGQFGPGGTPDNITSVGNRIFGDTDGNGYDSSQNQVFYVPGTGINGQPDLSQALGTSGLGPPDEISYSLKQSYLANSYPQMSNADALNQLYYLEPNLSSNSPDSDRTLSSQLAIFPADSNSAINPVSVQGNNGWAGAAA